MKNNNFNITLLTRSLDKTKAAFPGLAAISVNYDDHDALTESLRSLSSKQDALIILIDRNQSEAQINLIDAAISAGIPHIIPSAFGFTTTHPDVRKFPVLWPKAKMEDHLIQKADEGKVTYTQVQTSSFFDWALDRGVYLNTSKDPSAATMVFDGGDVPVSMTVMDDIGKAVAASLVRVGELKNRDVHVHTAVVTQNQLLRYAREAAPEREFKVVHLDSEDLERQAWGKYHAGDTSNEAMRGFLIRIAFGQGLGLFEKTDNELLRVKQWDDDEVRDFVAGYCK